MRRLSPTLASLALVGAVLLAPAAAAPLDLLNLATNAGESRDLPPGVSAAIGVNMPSAFFRGVSENIVGTTESDFVILANQASGATTVSSVGAGTPLVLSNATAPGVNPSLGRGPTPAETASGLALANEGVIEIQYTAGTPGTANGIANRASQVGVTAGWQDTFTIDAPGLTGSRGDLRLFFTLNGSVRGEAHVDLLVNDSNGGTADIGSGIPGNVYDSVTGGLTGVNEFDFVNTVMRTNGGAGYDASFVFGTPFTVTAQLYGFANGGAGYGAVNLIDTAIVAGFTVHDSNNNDVTGAASVTTASGTDYQNLHDIAIPEPASAALLLLGAGALVGRRRARR
jgi:hypothetical protein